MKHARFLEEQIIGVLKEAEAGATTTLNGSCWKSSGDGLLRDFMKAKYASVNTPQVLLLIRRNRTKLTLRQTNRSWVIGSLRTT